MQRVNTIFEYVTTQETLYERDILLSTKKRWGMKSHINRSALYRDSDIEQDKTDFTLIKNITRPILNLQYRTEDIDVKDVQLYVNDKDKYHLSFLVKKYHDDVFVVENDLDTYFDELNRSRIDFGAGLSKSLKSPCPETVPLQSVAFCDQRDILSRPIGLRHSYSPDELMGMAAMGWGKPENGATASLKDTIILAREGLKEGVSEGDIEVIEVHGSVPKRFAAPSDDSEEYESRLFIIARYNKKDSNEKGGIVLYTALETKSPFKLVKRDPIYGRALGFGGAEELFDAATGVNYSVLRKQDMIDAASKTLILSEDPAFTRKNKVKDLDNMEVLDVAPGMKVTQMDTYPRNARLFDESINEWEAHAQQMGAANDSIMGQPPTAGTPFKLQELVTNESHGLHDFRRGQFAKHIEEIYNDWIIPHIEKKICEGMTFLSELSLDELQYVTDAIITNESKKMQTEYVLSNGGTALTPEEVKSSEDQMRQQLKKRGNKWFIEILKNEFKSVPLAVKVNVAGKQKNLAGMVDKLTNVFKTIVANPYILSAPPIAALFNKIIEASGLDPIDLSNFNIPPMPTKRMTETINYADLSPADQQGMLKLAGIEAPQGSLPQQPQPQQQQQNAR